MVFIYDIFIQLYIVAIRLASLWNPKAKKWVSGRKNWLAHLHENLKQGDRIIWVHCASAGELEQGKPVIEALKEHYPQHRILLSFFSPSGFTAGIKYKVADLVCYLPPDTQGNARKFIDAVKPELAIFIKYEYWYHHLSIAAFHHIPVLLVSAIFRKQQVFFSSYGSFYRRILFLFRQIFVQDEDSKNLLKNIGMDQVTIAGDTRFDRVKTIAANVSHLPLVKAFAGEHVVMVAGSTWPDDENILASLAVQSKMKFIIAPHEIDEAHLKSIEVLFPSGIRYSAFDETRTDAKVLIIDNFGLLSRLYQYANFSYIGGGFNKSGIHNTLEAAVWGKPVIFGPNYDKFREAKSLIKEGAAYSIQSAPDLHNILNQLMHDDQKTKASGRAAAAYVDKETGATQKVLEFIQEKRLLTR